MTADELEYEFALRGIQAEESNCLTLLNNALAAESTGEVIAPDDASRITRLSVSQEIKDCDLKMKEINDAIKKAIKSQDDQLALTSQSRLTHVYGRILRLQKMVPSHTAVGRLVDRFKSITSSGQPGLTESSDAAQGIIQMDKSADQNDMQEDEDLMGAVGGVIRKSVQKSNNVSLSPEAIEQQAVKTRSGLTTRLFGSISDLFTGASTTERDAQFDPLVQQRTFETHATIEMPQQHRQSQPMFRTLEENQRTMLGMTARPMYYNAPTGTRTSHQMFRDPVSHQSVPQQNSLDLPIAYNNYPHYKSQPLQNNRPPSTQHAAPDNRSTFSRQEAAGLAGGHRIRQWALRFSGDPNGTDIEDFLFRLERQAQLNGVSHAALAIGIGDLLTDRAALWYWTNQRKTECSNWAELKAAFIRRYAPRKLTDNEIRATIENRKQRTDENFGDFCQDVEAMAVRLNRKMDENELVEVLRRNMLLQLRRATCFQVTETVDELIQCCDSFEKLYTDDEKQPTYTLRRAARVSEIEEVASYEHGQQWQYNEEDNQHQTIEALNYRDNRNDLTVCWNCRDLGHVFTQCNQPQTTIFCWSCGLSGVMRPQCPKCTGNAKKDATLGTARPSPAIPPQVMRRNQTSQLMNPFNQGNNPTKK